MSGERPFLDLSNKRTLSETNNLSLTLASSESSGGFMYLAWKGLGNENLNVATAVIIGQN